MWNQIESQINSINLMTTLTTKVEPNPANIHFDAPLINLSLDLIFLPII